MMSNATDLQQLSLKTKISTPMLEETRAFYERLFDMVVIEEWNSPDDEGVILAFDRDRPDALLEIYRADEPLAYSAVSLQFRVADLARFHASLPEELEYDGPTKRPWGSTYLYIRDPNDVLIIVYEGGW